MPKDSSISPELIQQTFEDLRTNEVQDPQNPSGFELVSVEEQEGLRVRVVGATALGGVMDRRIGPDGVEHESVLPVEPETVKTRPWWALPPDGDMGETMLPYTRSHAAREFLRRAQTPDELQPIFAALHTYGVEKSGAQDIANTVADTVIRTQPEVRDGLLRAIAAYQPTGKKAEPDAMLPRIARSLNMRTRTAMRLADVPERRELLDFDTLVEQLDENGLFETRVFNNVACMVWPGVASVIARRASMGEDVFADLRQQDNRQRYQLVSPYLSTLLSRIESLPDRHQQNAAKLKQRLFDEGSGSMPIKNLLSVANMVTVTTNKHRPAVLQQSLIGTTGIGLQDLLACGEATFRILEATSTTREQTEQNRAYAEVVDAILLPLYQHADRHRVVTVADICARYPDVTDDVTLRLREAASHRGYSAATRQYQEWRSSLGSTIYYRRNRPGAGIVS